MSDHVYSELEINGLIDRRMDERAHSHPFHQQQIKVLMEINNSASEVLETRMESRFSKINTKLNGLPEIERWVMQQQGSYTWSRTIVTFFLQAAAVMVAIWALK